MFIRVFRLVTTIICMVLFLQTSVFQPSVLANQGIQAQDQGTVERQSLEKLAAALGRPVDQLQFGDRATITLVNGKQLVKIKAIDTRTGEIIGATFDGEKVVDEAAVRQRASAEWHAAHAALTPAMVEKLARAPSSELFTVSVWLKVDVESLPRPAPEGETTGASASGVPTTSGENAPPVSETSSSSIPSAEKIPASPISPGQLPAVVRQALAQPLVSSTPGEPPSSEVSKPAGAVPPAEPETPQAARLRAAQTAFSRQNLEHLRLQVAPARERFLAEVAALGYQVQYASEIAPLVFLTGLSRDQVLDLAKNPEIDAIDDASQPGGPSLEVARVTQNVDLVHNFGGYNGSGVNVAIVEGGRVFAGNPYLTVSGVRDNTRQPQDHSTGVAGIVASTHSTVRGLAPGAAIYSANGDDYATIAALEAAMDWGSTNATVLNHSFWADDCGAYSGLRTIDRHLDYLVRYLYDFATVASGNFNLGGCVDPTTASPYVTSPGKAYNALTVGNFNDGNSISWSGDAMMGDSQYNHDSRFKPELAASGTTINSTTRSDPWVGGIGWGTSYASPMVAALGADMIQAQSALNNEPEVSSAIIMATALHNIEGDARLSRVDGVGAIDGSAALVTVERGNYQDVTIDSTTAFPLEYTQYAYQGERVRFAIRWLSNPDGSYANDTLPADLDLTAYRADGTTLIASSSNSVTNLEIVDFIAPATESYRFKVSLFGAWSGGNTWLGLGWWRGIYRVRPDIAYSDPQATPMGTHLGVLPTDFSPVNYWRVMGIRPVSTSDHDLRLYDSSWFDDPSLRHNLASSMYGTGAVDFTVVDGNHWNPSAEEFYVISRYSGTGGYNVSWSNLGYYLSTGGTYGPFALSSSEVVKVFDINFDNNRAKRIQIVPAASNAADLAVELFQSTAGAASTYTQSHGMGVARSDISTSPSQVEQLMYADTEANDYLGLVVYSKTQAVGSFYVVVEDMFFLPQVSKQ